MPHDEPEVGGVITAAWGAARQRRGTYAPAMTATGTPPTLGELGFLNGKWWANGAFVTVGIDFWITTNAGSPAGTISGTSWRFTLPFPADLSFHTTGVLNDPSDAIGSFHSRSGSAFESAAGIVLLAPPVPGGSPPGERMIFYPHESNGSIGGGDFTTAARIKAIAHYVADHGAMEAALA